MFSKVHLFVKSLCIITLPCRAVKNREHDAADPISCDIINTSEDWVTENEVGMEDTGSADWMNVVPPLGHMTLLGSEIEDIEALGAGNHHSCVL